jgi:glycosyltransferase involved in cell wall biosynthesis
VVHEAVTGLLVPSGVARSVADALLVLLRVPERRVRMGAAARVLVRSRFGAQRLADVVARLYDELSAR